MKEAAGEANMTVITIVLIAIVLAVGTIIVSRMMNSSGQSSACSSAGGTWQGGRCWRSETCQNDNGRMTCTAGQSIEINCGEEDGSWVCGVN